ncbi:MAG: protein arginine kinase [Chthoniobacterales bacterium]|nr:protein arginine kinase [Chthoniobacterales bacterium]
MKIEMLFENSTAWPVGLHSDIVVSSRVRLARNLDKRPFPGWAKKTERLALMEEIQGAVEGLPEMRDAFSTRMDKLTLLEKQLLIERHLISCEHAAKSQGSALVINPAQTWSFMINEEDHLRMQVILPGFQLQKVFSLAAQADAALEEKLFFAFHKKLGYLTACPTNIGTGMRASAMLHLPGLLLLEQTNKVINAVNKMGLVVRGLHGEGTEAIGNLFQVSNQATLGEKEETFIKELELIIEQIFQHEMNARTILRQEQPELLLDQVGRAYGILSHAYSLSTKEALTLLSLIKLGLDLHLFPEKIKTTLDNLFMEAQPAHLQREVPNRKLTTQERDHFRATLARARMRFIPQPALLR